MRLDEIMLDKFVNLLEGDVTILGESSGAEVEKQRKELLAEYQSIINPSGAKAMLSKHTSLTKERAKFIIWQMCVNLCSLNDFASVRDILSENGINTANLSDRTVRLKVKSLLKHAQMEVEKAEIEQQKPQKERDIRADFYRELAFVMVFYKMQINPREMSAMVYAYILRNLYADVRNRD